MRRTANRRQLKNYLIANRIHFKMMLANLTLMLLVIAVVIGAVLYPFYHEIFKINDIYAQHFSAKFFIVLLDRLSIAFIAVLLISLIYQMIINHRFCGPLVNFRHTFNKISQGDLTRKVFLRRYDFLKSEAAQVNDMIDFLSDHIMALKKDHGRLLSALEDMPEAQTDQDEYQNILETLKTRADICNKHLSIFKIDGINDRENQHRSNP
jgi:signal transduction histidine kinase